MSRNISKELYLRRGNLEEIKNVLIIGEESRIGGRDSAYKPSKGTLKPKFLKKKDPYSKSENLLYIHSTPNIKLEGNYKRDYQVHEFIKKYCKDLVVWDGESWEGIVCSREAFIVKGDIEKTIEELYIRLNEEISGKRKTLRKFKISRFILNLILFPFKLAITIILLFLLISFLKKRKFKRIMKYIWV